MKISVLNLLVGLCCWGVVGGCCSPDPCPVGQWRPIILWALSVTLNLHRASWALVLPSKSRSNTGRNTLKRDATQLQASSRYMFISTPCTGLLTEHFCIVMPTKSLKDFLILHPGCLEVLCYQSFPYRPAVHVGFLWADCICSNVQVSHKTVWILHIIQHFQ